MPAASPTLLQRRAVLITGANTGIGRVTARELSRLGAHVIAAGLSPERTQTGADATPGRCLEAQASESFPVPGGNLAVFPGKKRIGNLQPAHGLPSRHRTGVQRPGAAQRLHRAAAACVAFEGEGCCLRLSCKAMRRVLLF